MRDDFQSLRVVVCRPALPKDTADVMELTREIWEGHDYVLHVWAEWLADAQGVLAVAEYAGKVVGLAKLSYKGAGEWWMQGLRVHPAYQGQGVASRLHDYILNYWQRRLDRVLRLATSSARLPVHHLCERSGFSKVGEYLSYVAPALEGQAHGFVPVKEEEAPFALEYALKNPMHSLSFGFMDLSWYWGELTLERITDAIRQGHALWGMDHGGRRWALLVFDLDDDEEGDYPYIQYLACDVKQLEGALVEYRRLAGALGYRRCAWMAPDRAQILTALQEAGFQSDWENSLYLFEKRSLS